MPESQDVILARLDERTKDLPRQLEELRDTCETIRKTISGPGGHGERIAAVETDAKASKRLSVIISTAISGAVSGVAAFFGQGS